MERQVAEARTATLESGGFAHQFGHGPRPYPPWTRLDRAFGFPKQKAATLVFGRSLVEAAHLEGTQVQPQVLQMLGVQDMAALKEGTRAQA